MSCSRRTLQRVGHDRPTLPSRKTRKDAAGRSVVAIDLNHPPKAERATAMVSLELHAT